MHYALLNPSHSNMDRIVHTRSAIRILGLCVFVSVQERERDCAPYSVESIIQAAGHMQTPIYATPLYVFLACVRLISVLCVCVCERESV